MQRQRDTVAHEKVFSINVFDSPSNFLLDPIIIIYNQEGTNEPGVSHAMP